MKSLGKEVSQSAKPEGKEGIEKLGHRGYVGGLWDKIGLELCRDLRKERSSSIPYTMDALGSLLVM